MAGGKGNIRPEDGKQFSSEYQPNVEKWTEPIAMLFCQDLIDWLNEKDEDGEDKGNIFIEEFIFMVADPKKYHPKVKIYPSLPSYLSDKFSSFSKLLEKAKKIQEIKLYKYGVGDRLNATMTKFVLINEHGKVSDNSKVDMTSKGESINDKPDLSNLSKEEKRQLGELRKKANGIND